MQAFSGGYSSGARRGSQIEAIEEELDVRSSFVCVKDAGGGGGGERGPSPVESKALH